MRALGGGVTASGFAFARAIRYQTAFDNSAEEEAFEDAFKNKTFFKLGVRIEM